MGIAQNTLTEKSPAEIKAADPKPITPPAGQVPVDLVALGDGHYFSPYALVVDKSLRTLTVWKQDGPQIQYVEAFATDIGKSVGDKKTNGDFKTPEGVYFLQQILAGKDLNFEEYGQKAFTTDYPNFFDARKNKTGSGIWLHAIPDAKSLWRGSRGCVVVRNEVIPLLEKYIQLQKTPLIIRDTIKYVSASDIDNQRKDILGWLNSWKAAWESKDIDSYIANYSDEFSGLKMNKSQWKSFKNNLNQKYKSISVKIYQPVVYRHHNEVVVRFLQHYESDALSDFGEKHLYIDMDSQGRPRILGETWSELPRDLLASQGEGFKAAF